MQHFLTDGADLIADLADLVVHGVDVMVVSAVKYNVGYARLRRPL
jgi:hypothetical protein